MTKLFYIDGTYFVMKKKRFLIFFYKNKGYHNQLMKTLFNQLIEYAMKLKICFLIQSEYFFTCYFEN